MEGTPCKDIHSGPEPLSPCKRDFLLPNDHLPLDETTKEGVVGSTVWSRILEGSRSHWRTTGRDYQSRLDLKDHPNTSYRDGTDGLGVPAGDSIEVAEVLGCVTGRPVSP